MIRPANTKQLVRRTLQYLLSTVRVKIQLLPFTCLNPSRQESSSACKHVNRQLYSLISQDKQRATTRCNRLQMFWDIQFQSTCYKSSQVFPKLEALPFGPIQTY